MTKKNNENNFWKNVDKNNDCWLHSSISGKIRYNGRVFMTHRVAYEITYGPIDDHMFIIRSCGNEFCVRPNHLELQTNEQRFWSRVQKTNTCWNWTGQTFSNGYGQLRLGRKINLLAHRFSYELAYGDIPKNILVCHKCDNRYCVNPEHLFLGTHKDNTYDMMQKNRGVSPPGERNGLAVLTPDQVLTIRAEYAIGESTQKKLAKDFNVCSSTINSIILRKTWKHI